MCWCGHDKVERDDVCDIDGGALLVTDKFMGLSLEDKKTITTG